MPKRVIQGRVISKSGDKTASLLVERKIMHPKYRKYVKKHKKYLIHDEKNEIKVNDIVTAIECPPISKRKVFRLKNILSHAKIDDSQDTGAIEGEQS